MQPHRNAMTTSRWEFAARLHQRVTSEGSDSLDRQVPSIQQSLLDSVSSEPSKVEEQSARCCAHILKEVYENGYNVITEADLDRAISMSQSVSDAQLQIKTDIPSWLEAVGIQAVDTDYLRGGEFNQFDTIYLTPIGPTLEEALELLGNPLALSVSMIEDAVGRAITVDDTTCPAYRFRLRDVNEKEQAAFVGRLISELDRSNWVEGNEPGSLWIDPQAVDELLTPEGPQLFQDEVDYTIRAAIEADLSESLADLDSEIVLENLYTWLKNNHGWHTLVTDEKTRWYSSEELHERDLRDLAEHYQYLIEGEIDALANEIEKGLQFYHQNRTELIATLEATPSQVMAAITYLEGMYESERFFEQMEAAESGEDAPSIESKFQAKNVPNEYQVARDLEETLEERNSDEEESEREVETGRNIRF